MVNLSVGRCYYIPEGLIFMNANIFLNHNETQCKSLRGHVEQSVPMEIIRLSATLLSSFLFLAKLVLLYCTVEHLSDFKNNKYDNPQALKG